MTEELLVSTAPIFRVDGEVTARWPATFRTWRSKRPRAGLKTLEARFVGKASPVA